MSYGLCAYNAGGGIDYSTSDSTLFFEEAYTVAGDTDVRSFPGLAGRSIVVATRSPAAMHSQGYLPWGYLGHTTVVDYSLGYPRITTSRMTATAYGYYTPTIVSTEVAVFVVS